MTDELIRKYARQGAEIRLKEIRGEEEEIHNLFPDLKVPKKVSREMLPVEAPKSLRRRRRRKMSAEDRKAVSRRMKKYWARRRSEGS